MAKIVLGLVEPENGEVFIEGERWSNVAESLRKSRRSSMQLIAQDAFSSFDPRYTVEKIVGESLDVTGLRGAERRDRVLEVLEAVRLSGDCLARYPASFQAASASAWPSPGRSRRVRAFSSPMSR